MKTKIAKATRQAKDSSSGREESEAEETETERIIDSDNEDVQIIEPKSPDIVISLDGDESVSDKNQKKTNETKDGDIQMESRDTALDLSELTARIISLATIFLMIQPTGALFENIFSYVIQSIPILSKEKLREILKSYAGIFVSQELMNDGDDTSQEIWRYVGFGGTNMNNNDNRKDNDNGENNNSQKALETVKENSSSS